MKPIKTLDELKKELMSEHGAVYKMGRKLERFRIKDYELEKYRESVKSWFGSGEEYNHWFILNLEAWYHYEKPKKIIKESFDVFINLDNFDRHKTGPETCRLIIARKAGTFFNHKATITIEREVEDE